MYNILKNKIGELSVSGILCLLWCVQVIHCWYIHFIDKDKDLS